MSTLDYYLDGSYKSYVTSHKSVGDAGVSMFEALQPQCELFGPSVDEYALVLSLAQCNFVVDYGEETYRGALQPGQFVLYRPAYASRTEIDRTHRIRAFGLNARKLRLLGDRAGFDLGDSLPALHNAPFRSKVLNGLTVSLWKEALGGSLHGGLLADSLLTLITVELHRLSQRKTRDMQRTTKLDNAKLNTVFEYMKAHPNAKSSLADVAALVGLSEYHFLRCFRESTGTTPHQYLMERHIVEAQRLLATTKLSLADVAIDSGFSSQSHMSDVFRQKLGTSPGRWRKQNMDWSYK